jgi:hypothetical protein
MPPSGYTQHGLQHRWIVADLQVSGCSALSYSPGQRSPLPGETVTGRESANYSIPRSETFVRTFARDSPAC